MKKLSHALLASIVAVAVVVNFGCGGNSAVPTFHHAAGHRGSASPQNDDQGAARVMTYNLDEGTDYLEAIGALLGGNFANFQAAVQLTIDNVQATDPADRMATIARLIATNQPDLISVQEATQWRIGACKDSDAPAIDFLQLLLNSLSAQGQHYTPVVVVKEFDVSGVTPNFTCVRATNQDAIIAADKVQTSNVQSGHYQNQLTFSTFLGPVSVTRGWGSADVTVRGQSFHLVGTHLESFSTAVQIAQANELLQGPARSTLPVVLAADFNAVANNPNDPTYATYSEIVNAGFVDTWPVANPNDPGLTCCQDPLLLNPASSLSQRIDLIFSRGDSRVRWATLVGADPTDKTSSGLWPSDHAGVLSALKPDH
jgi:endonuclease/exonuclease/phosphatase family metal-dependent hydrolase